jgi:hypothetical protein
MTSFFNILSKIVFCRKNAVFHIYTRKSHTCRDCRLTDYVKSFEQFYILKNCLQTGRWFTELFVVNFFVKACIDIAQKRFHQMKKKKNQNHHYSLKYKKLNMQTCQFWSVVIFFLLKIDQLFLIRDANFNMN